jgi:type IV pilus assembly protein PilM
VALSRLFANEALIGIDIGSSSIKIVHAEPTKQGTRISNVVICPTPPGSVKEGVVMNVPEVASAIQFAIRSAGLKVSNAVAAIAGPGVTVRHVELPVMSEAVLRKSVYFEANKYISSSVEDSVIEFEILGKGQEQGQMNVLLVAAPKVMIDSKVNTIEQAGLVPLAIDVEVFAALRALIEHGSDTSLRESTFALLDIGASHTEINLVCGGTLALTRTIPIAGASLSNAIRNAATCSENEAEQRKFSTDLTELVDAPARSTQDPVLQGVQTLIDELLREIRRSVNYHQSQLPDGSADTIVDKVVLTGGTSRLKGLVPYTKSRLRMEVCGVEAGLGSLVSRERLPGEEDVPLMTVALGLALRDADAVRPLAIAA